MKVELSVYRRILRSVHAVHKRFSWSSDALFCVFGISASQAEFSAAGYGANMQEILHNCFMRPSIADDKHDKYSERLRAAFGLLRYLEQLHKHTEFRRVAESREEFVEKTYQNVKCKQHENDKKLSEKVASEIEEESKETESVDEGKTDSVEVEEAGEQTQISGQEQQNIYQEEEQQKVAESEKKKEEQQEKQEEKAAESDNAIDTIESPGTVVTNATLLLDYYNHQLIPLVMRVLLTPEEKIPSYAYMLPPEPFYAFEISERQSFAHIVDVLHVLSTVASSSNDLHASNAIKENKAPTQQMTSHVEEKEETEKKEKECNVEEHSDNTDRTVINSDNVEQSTKEEELVKETTTTVSCCNGLQNSLEEHTPAKENTTDKESNESNNEENDNSSKVCAPHASLSQSSILSISWPKTMRELINAVKCIPTRTRVTTDNLEVEVFSHYLCSGVNPERKSCKSKPEIGNDNNAEFNKTKTKTKQEENELAYNLTEKHEQKSRDEEQEISNTSNTNCKQNAELASNKSCTSESVQQQKHNKSNKNKNNSSTKDNYSQKDSASSTTDDNDNDDAEAVSFSEEMKRYAFHSARNDNAHLFQITIVVRNMCDENEKEKPIYYQTLSHHFTFLNYHDHTSVETVGPGLCGNKVHLEPGNSHVFQTGAVVNGTDGVFRGTLQVIKIRKNGQMSTFDAVIAPTRLSVPEEMIEDTHAIRAKGKNSLEKEKESKVQPSSAHESVKAQDDTFSEPTNASTINATTTVTSVTNDTVAGHDNDKCDNKKEAERITDDLQSTENINDSEQCNNAEYSDVNVDNTSTVTELENTALKSSDVISDSTNSTNTCKKENSDVPEVTAAVKIDENAAKEREEVEKKDENTSLDTTTLKTESKSSDGANSDETKLPPKE